MERAAPRMEGGIPFSILDSPISILVFLSVSIPLSTFGNPPDPIYPRTGIEVTLGNDMSDAQGPEFKAMGVTSVESYVTWQTVEEAGEGKWDWSKWDAQVEILKKHGIGWVPFLIAGCAYATPTWYREGPQNLGAVCLEHGIASKVQSIWNPALPAAVDRFLKAFADRYRDAEFAEAGGGTRRRVIESVLLGVTGDYGEAIFPVWGGGWTFQVPGKYHTHPGYWCGDPHAKAAFRKAMLARYGSLEKQNAAWGTSFASADAVDMPPLEKIVPPSEDKPTPAGRFLATTAADRRRWLDFAGWYRRSMADWSDLWLGMTRKHFPESEIYLCTGGDAVVPHGSDFGLQSKIAAKHKAGVRITNEGSDYAQNYYNTRWVTSAGRFYGAYVGIEPAGHVDDWGNIPRIYNVAATGAGQFHGYGGNFGSDRQKAAFRDHRNFLKPGVPRVPVALWYPKTALALDQWNWGPASDWRAIVVQAVALRDLTDHAYVDEGMLRDGALDGFSVLVAAAGKFIEAEDLARIRGWVEAGGTLLATDFADVQTVEGDAAPWKALFRAGGGEQALGKGRTILVKRASPDDWPPVVTAVQDVLARSGGVVADGDLDTVYATVFADRVLYLNATDKPVEKILKVPGKEDRKVTVPPRTILETAW